jgi:hypothetical protein
MRSLKCEQVTRRLVGSIVDDHKLTRRVSLRIKRIKTPFKQRRTIPRYDDCGYSYHEGTSLTYGNSETTVQCLRFFRWPQVEARTNHVTAYLVKHATLLMAL